MFHGTLQHNTTTTRFFFFYFTIYRENKFKRIQNSHKRFVPLSLNIQSNKNVANPFLKPQDIIYI